ncbi:MAG TPA: GNAT family N-acetyltransferase [Rubricoccaceae bacterium]|jgi:ribosomal protein S18 acetylase RimI-like enzyme
MTIRTATDADAALLADLGARTFRGAFAADNDPADLALYIAEAFTPERLAAELADPVSTFFVALDAAGAPVGYARLVADVPHAAVPGTRVAEIERIYADQSVLGQGVGAALMQASLDAATGHDAVWLGVWERNPRAIRFYERWGFETVGDKTFTVGTDVQRDVVMARRLPGDPAPISGR